MILGVMGVILSASLMISPKAEAVSAGELGLTTVGAVKMKEGNIDTTCEKNLFGMRPWYAGLSVKDTQTNKCVIGTPDDDNEVVKMVWVIVLNVMVDISVIIGYLALGFVIYGGYLYILSGGDAGKVAKGKKTLLGAVIGVAISLLASVIVNTILAIIEGK